MFSRIARFLLGDLGTTEVEVLNFKQIAPGLGVLSFSQDGHRYDDVYNVNDEAVMETLLLDRAGKKVFATLVPDSSEDEDGHPEITAASFEEEAAVEPKETPEPEVEKDENAA